MFIEDLSRKPSKTVTGLFQGQGAPVSIGTRKYTADALEVGLDIEDDTVTLVACFDPMTSQRAANQPLPNLQFVTMGQFSINGMPLSYRYYDAASSYLQQPLNPFAASIGDETFMDIPESYGGGPNGAFIELPQVGFPYWKYYDSPTYNAAKLANYPQEFGSVTQVDRRLLAQPRRAKGTFLKAYMKKSLQLNVGDLPNFVSVGDYIGSLKLEDYDFTLIDTNGFPAFGVTWAMVIQRLIQLGVIPNDQVQRYVDTAVPGGIIGSVNVFPFMLQYHVPKTFSKAPGYRNVKVVIISQGGQFYYTQFESDDFQFEALDYIAKTGYVNQFELGHRIKVNERKSMVIGNQLSLTLQFDYLVAPCAISMQRGFAQGITSCDVRILEGFEISMSRVSSWGGQWANAQFSRPVEQALHGASAKADHFRARLAKHLRTSLRNPFLTVRFV